MLSVHRLGDGWGQGGGDPSDPCLGVTSIDAFIFSSIQIFTFFFILLLNFPIFSRKGILARVRIQVMSNSRFALK